LVFDLIDVAGAFAECLVFFGGALLIDPSEESVQGWRRDCDELRIHTAGMRNTRASALRVSSGR
jgi:hypothetical protein